VTGDRTACGTAAGQTLSAGLANDAIPEGARLLAIVDAWDVMTCGRQSQPAKTIQELLAELQRWAGVQLSPQPVAVWARLDWL